MRKLRRILILLVVAISIVLVGFYGVKALTGGPELISQITDQGPKAPALDPNILYPDLVPLPASEMVVQTAEDGTIHLLFSTTYYNRGLGTLELRADPRTAGIRADLERDILQRVYHKDGTYEESVVGTFLWHQEHLHYHYSDFITYDLMVVDGPENEELDGILVKSTFCLRDISRVDLDLENTPPDAKYKICGKELQGVSVGWGDTYYYNYPAQDLDISSLSSGTYKLVFTVNPERKLKEITLDNNVSSVTFKLDMEAKTVEVLSQDPVEIPEIEHVYLDDPFGI